MTVHSPIVTSRRLSTSDQRQHDVLCAARTEFADRGLAGASTERVARAAGIAHSYLFKLFGTKQDLFLAVTDTLFDELDERFGAAARSAPGAELDAMASAFVELVADPHPLRLLLHAFAASGQPVIADRVRRRYLDLLERVRDLSGADEEHLRRFWAHGMLLMVASALDGPDAGVAAALGLTR